MLAPAAMSNNAGHHWQRVINLTLTTSQLANISKPGNISNFETLRCLRVVTAKRTRSHRADLNIDV